jgi:predicted Zn finger-like uncharacterized protein
MIIACPACATRYAVPDGAIGVDGRTVRCAKCRNSWFQDGPALVEAMAEAFRVTETVAAAPVATPEPAQQAAPRPAPAFHDADDLPPPPPIAPVNSTAQASTVQAANAALHEQAEGPEEDYASSFAHEPPFRPRRNPARMWTALAVGFALVTTGAMAAVAKFGVPDWLPIAHAPQVAPDLKLSFPAGKQERRPLANGNDYFNISGTVTNTGQQRRNVPGLLIVMRDARNRAVYSVEVAPPKAVLAPGESQAINTAIVDAPKSAVAAEVQWKQS